MAKSIVTEENQLKQIEKTNFFQAYESIKEDILESLKKEEKLAPEIIDELIQYYSQCLDYTCIGGKMTRGIAVMKAAEAACKNNNNKNNNDLEIIFKKSGVLGWCVEILQALFLVADDMMDHSHTRRGLPCWYKLENVTLSNAMNDTLFLNSIIYFILKKHFKGTKEYISLIEIFFECTNKTIIGQHLDTNAQLFSGCNIENKKFDINRITMTRYKSIVTHKTAYYSFYLPCALGMILAGVEEESSYEKVKDVCMKLGEYFQTQDDYLDCFADPVLLGKIGTDIQENKCSWLLVQAVEKASYEDKEILKQSYGKNEKEKVEWVKQLYKRLNLEQAYKDYEEKAKLEIENMIEKIESAGLQELLLFFLQKIYRREK